jgi:hypothetical protein
LGSNESVAKASAMSIPQSCVSLHWDFRQLSYKADLPLMTKVREMAEYFADTNNFEFIPHQNGWIIQMLQMLEGVARLACTRFWQLIQAEDGAFVTSDAL